MVVLLCLGFALHPLLETLQAILSLKKKLKFLNHTFILMNHVKTRCLHVFQKLSYNLSLALSVIKFYLGSYQCCLPQRKTPGDFLAFMLGETLSIIMVFGLKLILKSTTDINNTMIKIQVRFVCPKIFTFQIVIASKLYRKGNCLIALLVIINTLIFYNGFIMTL